MGGGRELPDKVPEPFSHHASPRPAGQDRGVCGYRGWSAEKAALSTAVFSSTPFSTAYKD